MNRRTKRNPTTRRALPAATPPRSTGYGGNVPNLPVATSSFFNGTFLETFDATVTSDGATITMSLEQSGTGDLTMLFSDGGTTLDCTPAATIALTAGSDTSPQGNWIYVLQSTKVLTKSTTAWPTVEHIKVGYFLVPSAGFTQTNGCYINQNWNDHHTDTANLGHLPHMARKIRELGASYFSGLAGAGTDDYLTIGVGTVDLKIAAGVASQMHPHTIPAFATSAGDVALVKNWSGDAYHDITDLYDIVADSTGTTIGNNRYFNIVIWTVCNKGGEYQPTMINLPGGFYTSLSSAQNDVDGYDDFSIPREFDTDSSTGLLVCRLTVQKTSTTWVYKSTTDLRGTTPQSASGGAAGTVTDFADNQFRVHDETDPTKLVALQVSGVTTATTRTLTIPDSDGTILLEETVGLWTTWSPTPTNFTIGNGTEVYRYTQIGKTIHLRIHITFGSTTAFTGIPTWTVPVTEHAGYGNQTGIGVIWLSEAGVGSYTGVCRLSGSASVLSAIIFNTAGTYASQVNINTTVPFTWGTGDELVMEGTYEAA